MVAGWIVRPRPMRRAVASAAKKGASVLRWPHRAMPSTCRLVVSWQADWRAAATARRLSWAVAAAAATAQGLSLAVVAAGAAG
eukprot:scaffold90053_cov58-Phaeocystis_antarctica.AAC.5